MKAVGDGAFYVFLGRRSSAHRACIACDSRRDDESLLAVKHIRRLPARLGCYVGRVRTSHGLRDDDGPYSRR